MNLETEIVLKIWAHCRISIVLLQTSLYCAFRDMVSSLNSTWLHNPLEAIKIKFVWIVWVWNKMIWGSPLSRETVLCHLPSEACVSTGRLLNLVVNTNINFLKWGIPNNSNLFFVGCNLNHILTCLCIMDVQLISGSKWDRLFWIAHFGLSTDFLRNLHNIILVQ